MRRFHFSTFMDKAFDILFSPIVAALVGLLTASALVFLIVSEASIQPLQDSYRSDERLSDTLKSGVVYTQEIDLARTLNQADFLVGLYFGCKETECGGRVEARLIQGEREQTQVSAVLYPDPVQRHQFSFKDFSSGRATLEIRGMNEGSLQLFYMIKGTGPSLSGPGIPEQAFLSVDFFKVIPGNEKLSIGFHNAWIGGIWLATFAGLIGLSWCSVSLLRRNESATES